MHQRSSCLASSAITLTSASSASFPFGHIKEISDRNDQVPPVFPHLVVELLKERFGIRSGYKTWKHEDTRDDKEDWNASPAAKIKTESKKNKKKKL